jgi:hypothetical protein
MAQTPQGGGRELGAAPCGGARLGPPHEITFDALPGSALPCQFTTLGYIVTKVGDSERILLHS